MNVEQTFAGRVALITGASRGIGRAVALQLAQRGGIIAINFRKDQQAAASVARHVEALGSTALLCRADLEDPEEVRQMVTTVGERFGHIDVLVANAAATAFKPLMEVHEHNIHRTMAITIDAFVLMVQECVRWMNTGARIVAVSGFDSVRYLPRHGVLGAAKAALEALVRYWGCELAGREITVNAVCPGMVKTDSARIYAGEKWEEMRNEAEAFVPLGRMAEPDEIAAAIRFFCSNESSYVTGQTLIVDGGLTLPTRIS